MADNYQTIFGTTPISEPSTKGFDSGTPVSVNTEVNQGIGNLLTGIAQTIKQTTEFGTEIAMQSAEDDANDVLVKELEAMGPGGGAYLNELRKKHNWANNLSNETVRNLRLSKLRTELRAKHRGSKARAIIDGVFKNTIGTASPAGSIMDEATRTERAATAARIAKHKEDLATAERMNLTVFNNGKVDEAATIKTLRSIQATTGTYLAAKNSLKGGGGGSVAATTKFRGKLLSTFNTIRDNSVQETGIRIASLLTAHKDANEIQKPVIAAQIGNVIEGMRSRIEKQFRDSGGSYLSEAEMAYITDEPMQIWRTLTRGTELQDAWIEGKLVEKEQMDVLLGVTDLITKGAIASYPTLRILNNLTGTFGSSTAQMALDAIGTTQNDLKNVVAALGKTQTKEIQLAFEVLQDPKKFQNLSKDEKKILGLPVNQLLKKANEVHSATKEEKGTDAANEVCAGLLTTAAGCITNFDSQDNKEAILTSLTSNNVVSVLDKLMKDPSKKDVVHKTLRVINEETARTIGDKIKKVVENTQNEFGVNLEKGDLVWTDVGIDFSDAGKKKLEAQGWDIERTSIDDLVDDTVDTDEWLNRLGNISHLVGPEDKKTGKKLSKSQWLNGMVGRMLDTAIDGTPYERGWFNWGGFPDAKAGEPEGEGTSLGIIPEGTSVTKGPVKGLHKGSDADKVRRLSWQNQ